MTKSPILAVANPNDLSRRGFLQLGSFVIVTAAVSSCASPSSNSTPPKGGGSATLTVAVNRPITTLDNKLVPFDFQVTLQRAVHQALTWVGPDLEIVNVLADSIERTGSNEWTVKLNTDAKYSDGSPVTVADISKSIEMYKAVGGLTRFFGEWPTVQEVDEQTFVLQTPIPSSTMDSLMSYIMIAPADENKPEETDVPLGTGPYTITERNPQAGEFTLSRNESFWGPEAPQVETVKVRYIAEDSVRLAALKRGEIDVMDAVPPDAIAELESTDGIEVYRSPGTRLTHLFYNFRKPKSSPLSRASVREALTYAVDGQSLIKELFLDSVSELQGVVPQTLVGWYETGKYTYDPDKARSMLAAEGASDLEMTIIWEAGEFLSDAAVMEAIGDMLGQVGVKVSLKQFSSGDEILEWRQGKAGDWDVFANGFGNLTGQAIHSLQFLYASTPEMEKTRDSYQGFVFPEIAEVIVKASAEEDEAQRSEYLRTAQEQVWAQWPALWGFVQNNSLAYRSRVSGIELSPVNSYDLINVRVDS